MGTHDLKLANWIFFYSMKHLWNWKLPTTTSNLKLISYWNSNLTGTILESSKCNCHLTETWLKLVTAKTSERKILATPNIPVETCKSSNAYSASRTCNHFECL